LFNYISITKGLVATSGVTIGLAAMPQMEVGILMAMGPLKVVE
jgi:hypothetical protein